MNGIQLDYELKKGVSSEFATKLFGRISISSKNRNTYYIPGIFNDIPFFKIFNGRVFVGTTGDIDYDSVMQYCTKFSLSNSKKDINDLHLRTGKEKWKFFSNERGYKIDWR